MRPIYIRIIVDGIRVELSTLRKCEAFSWHSDSERKDYNISFFSNLLNFSEKEVLQSALINHSISYFTLHS